MRCVTAAMAGIAQMAPTAPPAQAEVLRKLALQLQGGCSMDEVDENGDTGLLHLCKGMTGLGVRQEFDLSKAFLAMGADCHVADDEGNTPLHYAAHAGKVDLVRLLCEEGDAPQDARNMYGTTPVLVAVSQGHNETVAELLAQGVNVNLPDASQNTPLHIACEYGRRELAQVLLAHGADVGAKNALMMSPEACSWGETAMLFKGRESQQKPIVESSDPLSLSAQSSASL